MEKVLRHPLGADAVDIDAKRGTCWIAFDAPVELDFKNMQAVTAEVGLVLSSMSLQTKGEVIHSHCYTCQHDVPYLRLSQTDQLIELVDSRPDGPTEMYGFIIEWKEGHPRLWVDGWRPPE